MTSTNTRPHIDVDLDADVPCESHQGCSRPATWAATARHHDGAACQIQLLCDVDRQAVLVDIARIHAAERTPACSIHMQAIDVTWRRI